MASSLKHGIRTLSIASQLSHHAVSNLCAPVCSRCLRTMHTMTVPASLQVLYGNGNSFAKSSRFENALHKQSGLNIIKQLSTPPVRLEGAVLDALQSEIAATLTLHDLFSVIGRNRDVLEMKHVCMTMEKLKVVLESLSDDDGRKEVVIKLINSHDEFKNLWQKALSQVNSMTNDELTNSMLATRAYFPDDPSHPLVRELYAEGSRRVDDLSIQQLSKLASFVRFTYPRINSVKLIGNITARFMTEFDSFDHSNMREMVFIMNATVNMSTKEFQNIVLRKVTTLLQEAADGDKVELCAKDIMRILNYEWKAYRECSYPELNRLCCQFLQDHIGLENVATEQIHTVCNLLLNLECANSEFFEDVNAELLARLKSMTSYTDIAGSLEFLGVTAHYNKDLALKGVIENKIDEVLDKDNPPLGRLCIALRRMRHLNLNPLVKKLIKRVTHQAKEFDLVDIVHIMEYFKNPDLPIKETGVMYARLLDTLLEFRTQALSPLFMVNIFYCISLMPKEILEDTDFNLPMYEGILPQLNDRLINLLSFILVRLKRKLDSEKVADLQDLLAKVNFQAISNIDQNKSISHLLNLSQFILEEGGGDIVFLDQAMKQYTDQVSKIRHPQMAIRCANILHRAGYLHSPLMDKIAEVITKNINQVHPSQVLGILQPFCNLGHHDPPGADEFYQACIDRILPFLDTVETESKPNPFYLVMLATNLSCVQIFPEALLRKIFTLGFLNNFDAALRDLALQGRWKLEAKNRRLLMNLNRTVVLECPQLQIPWFHEEYCQRMLQRRSQRLHDSELEVQSVLVEVLGGAQYLRSMVISPYFSDILFEYVLDAEGNPLPVAEYGSYLNFGSRSNRVISDLMQWGTQSKSLPEGAQRVAIDYMNPACYNINASSLLGGYIIKKRQLEILGYRHIQIPYYEWRSSSLPEKTDKAEYLQRLLFHKTETPLPAGPHTVLRDEHLDHQRGIGPFADLSERAVTLPGQKTIGGLNLRIREDDVVEDPMLMRVLNNLTKSTEGKHF